MTTPSDPGSSQAQVRVSLRQLALAFAKIGTVGVGGAVGMLALLRHEVVLRRRWIDDRQLGVAVAMGQMLPGPFIVKYAQQVGHELRGVRGMLVAVTFLLIPWSSLMCVLSFLYFRFGSVPVVERLFTGVQPVVAGILAWATWSIGRANVRNWRAAAIAALAFAALVLKVDIVIVVLGAGVLGILLSGAWRCLVPRRVMGFAPLTLLLTAVATPWWRRLLEVAATFLKVGALSFGGGYAAIPLLEREVVHARHWLTAHEFIDGVAIGQMTPGPLVITSTFIGYKVSGLAGALVATVAVFLPSFLLLWGLMHVYRRVKGHPLVAGFLSGVLPAVTGMLLSATVYLGRAALAVPGSEAVALLSLVLLVRFAVNPLWLVLGGAGLGLLLR